MKGDKEKYKAQLLDAIEIQVQIVSGSQHLDKASKNALINHSEHLIELLNGKLTLAQMKSLSSDFLIYWNESIGIDAEAFWVKMRESNIEFERKDELKFVLLKKRFRRVDQGMAARMNWEYLKQLQPIKDRFSLSEIDTIGETIQTDEEQRLEVLQKCLRKKAIPKSQYLKFGECMAYFGNCNLFEQYFSQAEESDLYEIWESFDGD